MKIGIISEFKLKTINYGNHLQAYALNQYLRREYPSYKIESLDLPHIKKIRITALSFQKVYQKVSTLVFGREKTTAAGKRRIPEERLSKFIRFAENNIVLSDRFEDWKSLKQADYDTIIVGSDIVWYQGRYCINRVKFLDFKTGKNFRKIAYAASFGRDYIPEENKKPIYRLLKRFEAISVREKSSTALLAGIGIINAVHALDPTLLLDEKHWTEMEQASQEQVPEKYAFVYLLGRDVGQRQSIMEICGANGLKIVTIPSAVGADDDIDQGFGEIQLDACGPQEWIWLIHHAEYVITDSFHGIVFATIFKKKFLVVKRHSTGEINNRLEDYLDTIDESDKLTDLVDIGNISVLSWDYEKIYQRLVPLIASSKEFLRKAINC